MYQDGRPLLNELNLNSLEGTGHTGGAGLPAVLAQAIQPMLEAWTR